MGSSLPSSVIRRPISSRAPSDKMQTLGFIQKAGTAYACIAISADGGHAVRRYVGSSAKYSAERLYCRARQIGCAAVGAKLAVAAVHGETWSALGRPRSAAADDRCCSTG